MKKIVLKIGGMTCSACSSGLEKYLNKQEGIASATVNLVLSIATITYQNITVKDIERFIKEAGFTILHDDYIKNLGHELIDKYALIKDENIFECTKLKS